jgi:hypothetical protein
MKRVPAFSVFIFSSVLAQNFPTPVVYRDSRAMTGVGLFTFKYLGVTLDHELNMKDLQQQIIASIQKSNGKLQGMLNNIRSSRNHTSSYLICNLLLVRVLRSFLWCCNTLGNSLIVCLETPVNMITGYTNSGLVTNV